ncbi:MAG: twin-arginine translocase TatA/TatE family subunit [Planctomycetaceae bacterium]
MFGINAGPGELIIVGIIALLLFGKRLPEVARNLGKGLSEFKKGMNGIHEEVREASRNADRSISYSPPKESSAANRPAASELDSAPDDEFVAPRFTIDD